MARLIVEKGHEKGKSIPLPAKATTIFGRDTTANVQIKDTMASRLHFRIEPRGDEHWIVELQSMNGTLLNGHPVKEAKLNPGDLIRVGETTYSFLADDAGADPLLGQRLGGYKLLERVGRGGMGTVYKAEQVDLQRAVALKIISEEHLKNPEFIELFVHEARAAAKLNHPNIVQVYDVKKSNELYFFSMEFVPGGSVQDLLNVKRKVPIADAVRMILEAARGLEYAHRKEIIHRDVKPDNFMIGEGGTIKIGDLGLAQRLGEKLSADNEDTVIGTPHYIAPEQVLGRPADIRSDVYSLGSTMYRMIAGFTPFQAPSIRDLVNKKAREEAVPLHQALDSVPESLGKIIEKMMARMPEQRTQSMSDVIAELEAWTRASNASDDTKEAPPVHRKLLVTAIALLAVVVVGGVIAATAMLKKGDKPPKVDQPPVVEGEDPGGAEAKFDRAAAEERSLVDAKPDEFEAVIKLYDAIVTRWPGTPYARDSQTRMEGLKTRRVGLMAARGLEALDKADRESWAGLLQSFQAGREDLSEAEKRQKDFRAFADDAAWKGTESAGAAGRRADAIAAWMAEVLKRKEACEALQQKSEALIAEGKYKDAWEACNEFISDIAAYPAPSKDRYTTLLYDLPARRLQEKIVEQANKSFQDASAKAAALEAKGEYSQAVQLLESAVRFSLKDPIDRARKQGEEIQQRWTAANKLAGERAAEEQRKLAELDRKDFDAAARRWHESVVKFDPATALSDARSLARSTPDKFPRLPAAEARIASRVATLRLLADFKETLLRSLAEKSVSNKITIEKLTGTISKATDTTVTIDLGSGSQIDRTYEGMLAGATGSAKAIQFLEYLRGAGKTAGAKWSMGLAVLELELGLYERAVDEIKVVEKATDDASRKFVVEFKPLAEDLRYSDSDEVEAQKHFDRLQVALKEPTPRYDIARTIQILKTRFGETELVVAQKTKLDEIEKDRGDRDLKEKDKVARAEKYKKIQAAQFKAQADSKSRETEILRGLAAIKEPIERGYHLGEAQFGFGYAAASNKTLADALDQAFRKFPIRNPQDPVLIWTARIGGSLMRNLHLQKKETSDIVSKIDAKYEGENAVWSSYKEAHEAWTAQVADRIKKHGDKLANLEKELQENPDPKVLYDLAEAQDTLRNAYEARGLYAALLSEFPDYEKSKNAETHLRLAEMTYMLRDVGVAEQLYKKFKADFPMHPKVAQAAQWDPTSVENRIRSCNTLKNNMGLK